METRQYSSEMNTPIDEKDNQTDNESSDQSINSDTYLTSDSLSMDLSPEVGASENILQSLQYYFLQHNSSLIRRLSTQASNATTDFETFKRWMYQDLEQHCSQLTEASSNLFFRNEKKYDIAKYDLVITFHSDTDPKLVVEFQHALSMLNPSFIVQKRKHYFANYEEDALYLTADENFFLFHSSQQSFDTNDQYQFENNKHCSNNCKLSSMQRQAILSNVIKQWCFELKNASSFESITQMNTFDLLSKSLKPGDKVIENLQNNSIINQVFPLHHEEDLTLLKHSWVTQFFSCQPLDKICEYFGIKIAIYFAFIGYYNTWLLFPTFFGLFLIYLPWLQSYCPLDLVESSKLFAGLIQLEEALLNDILLFAFTIFNMFWSTIMLQKWNKKCAQLVQRWTRQYPTYVENFYRKNKFSKFKPEPEPEQSHLSRTVFKFCITFPIIGLSLAITFAIMWRIFHFQTWWDRELIEKTFYPSWTRFVPKIMLAVFINVSNYIYYIIALWLNHKENYNNAESRENNLILKLVLFQFFNSYMPLLYIAFIDVDVEKLQEHLAAQLITRQVIGNFNEAVWPFLKESYKIATRKLQCFDSLPTKMRTAATAAAEQQKNTEKNLAMSKGELEACMYRYESTFDDYLELLVQFGYVMLFAPVFPLAALCALLNNLIEIRSDAFKLCFVYQRPFGHEPAHSIGEWANVMQYLSVAAIAINCALMMVTGKIARVFGFHDSAQILLTSVVIEHCLLFTKWLIPNII